MTIEEGKKTFIQAWGTLGSKWGINRTMAQVHALLLVSPHSLSSDDIIAALNISRGNANMNLRALVDWRLVKKEFRPGQRKEYFFAEKDVWKMTRYIIAQRKKRELEPIQDVLSGLRTDITGKEDEVVAFLQTINDLHEFATTADAMLNQITKSDRSWFLESLVKMVSKKQ